MPSKNITWTNHEATISIGRQNKKIAIFNQFDCVRDFESFTDEVQAGGEAEAWIRENTNPSDLAPAVKYVYPQITRVRMTLSKPKTKKKK